MDADTSENGCQNCGISQPVLPNNKNSKKSVTQEGQQRINGAYNPVPQWLLHICPTTGGELELTVPSNFTVEGLKHIISKKLKLPMDRINLLYKERLLKSGPLIHHGVMDGCKFTLLPNVESGLSTQKTDHSIMQVLETLSDKQVNEFLSGKSPLTIAMRIGEHMMFVQLQLSSSPFTGSNRHPQPNHHQHNHHVQHLGNGSSTTRQQARRPILPYYRPYHQHHPNHQQQRNQHHHYHQNQMGVSKPDFNGKSRDPTSICQHVNTTSKTENPHACNGSCGNYKQSNNIQPSLNVAETTRELPEKLQKECSSSDTSSRISKENNLSNILSEQFGAATKHQQLNPAKFKSPPRPTRVLDSPFDTPPASPAGYSSCSSLSDCSPPSSPELTPIMSSDTASSTSKTRQRKGNPTRLFHPESATTLDNATETLKHRLQEWRNMSNENNTPSNFRASEVDSKNLSNKENCKNGDKQRPAPGAVIDSMHHVGKGVYSGTFSGTLNPALNDGEGKPKRSLSTIVHILNDLLGAAPQGRIQIESISSGIGRGGQHAWNRTEINRRGRIPGSPPQSMLRNKSLDEYKKQEKENQVMKDKVEQVQMMLQQRRQRRRAKREARSSPYGWQPEIDGAKRLKTDTATSDALQNVNMDTSCPPEEDIDDTSGNAEESSTFPSELKPEAVLV